MSDKGVELGANDSCIVFRADGKMEAYVPDTIQDDDAVIEPNTPLWNAGVVMTLFGSEEFCLEKRREIYEWFQSLVEGAQDLTEAVEDAQEEDSEEG